VVLAGPLVLSACSLPPPDPAPLALTITAIAYDCSTKVLVVDGATAPVDGGLPVQVLVRTAVHKREPVWLRVKTNADGVFHASARYLHGAEKGATALAVRAGTVVGGVRVFSEKESHPVGCG
jgi:hypothetical protein